MRTAVVWVEGVFSEDLSLTRSQVHVEGMVFCRSLFAQPSAYNFILASNQPGDVVAHWLRSHGLIEFQTNAAEVFWSVPTGDAEDQVGYLVTLLTKRNRHDLRLWVDAEVGRCTVALVRYGISSVLPRFSRQALTWRYDEQASSFAPFAGGDED